jgi:tRNA(adenine34) deaminase
MIQKEKYMMRALEEAQVAFDRGEIPVGAVIVDPYGKIISVAANEVEKQQTQMAHAELLAIKRATDITGDWRLEGCTLFVTLEPCVMCIGIIGLSRIERLFYGASSPVYGFERVVSFDEKNPLFSHLKLIQAGVLHDKAADLLEKFFRSNR